MKRFGVLGSRAKRVIFGCSFFSLCFVLRLVSCHIPMGLCCFFIMTTHLLFFSLIPPLRILAIFMDVMYFICMGQAIICIAILFQYRFLAHINGSAKGFSSIYSHFLGRRKYHSSYTSTNREISRH